MYQGETRTGEAAKKLAADGYPFGPGWPEELVERIHKVEIWHSSFNDPGPDFNLFKAIDAEGKLLTEKKIGGY
jgi:hypothetical protein